MGQRHSARTRRRGRSTRSHHPSPRLQDTNRILQGAVVLVHVLASVAVVLVHVLVVRVLVAVAVDLADDGGAVLRDALGDLDALLCALFRGHQFALLGGHATFNLLGDLSAALHRDLRKKTHGIKCL